MALLALCVLLICCVALLNICARTGDPPDDADEARRDHQAW